MFWKFCNKFCLVSKINPKVWNCGISLESIIGLRLKWAFWGESKKWPTYSHSLKWNHYTDTNEMTKNTPHWVRWAKVNARITIYCALLTLPHSHLLSPVSGHTASFAIKPVKLICSFILFFCLQLFIKISLFFSAVGVFWGELDFSLMTD